MGVDASPDFSDGRCVGKRKLQVRAANFRLPQGTAGFAARDAPLDVLERLFRLHGESGAAIALPEGPGAGNVRRHDPQVGLCVVSRGLPVRLPFIHEPAVRNDSRAGLHGQQRRAQSQKRFHMFLQSASGFE